jgi:hypothetical protein
MWRMSKGLVVTATALLGLVGCHKAEYVPPPRPKEVFAPPPVDDPRFSSPPNYPAALLNQDTLHGKAEDDASGHGPGLRTGAGAH